MKQNRVELFAVAAVAFTLRHDAQFRQHFLHQVCGVDWPAEARLEIEVQPHHHTDLAVKLNEHSHLVVVEFKVGAILEPKQNPRNTEDFWGADGYGTLILAEAAYKAFSHKSYVVLDSETAFEAGDTQGLKCIARTWKELVDQDPPTGGLWEDLVSTLAELGVTDFQSKALEKMNNAQFTKQAVCMHQTVECIAARLKFGLGVSDDINRQGEDAWYGRNIPNRRLSGFLELEVRVQSRGNALGWYGYQAGPNHSECSVWFYCGSPEAAGLTAQFMAERFRSGPPGRIQVQGAEVSFQLEGSPGVGDLEWFEQVFSALADNKRST